MENHARCSKTGRTAFGLDGVSLASDDERVERANRARFSSRPPNPPSSLLPLAVARATPRPRASRG
jgi:hypothetical protein